MNNLGQRRLDNLRVKDKDAFNAVNWLRENKGQFSGEITEPIITQVSFMISIKDR